MERLEQAREAFEKALEVKPENADAWQLRGKVLFETGLEKEALHAFEKATRQKPDFPEAWYEKGRVFLRLGNPKGAENAFKIAADLWENKGLETEAETAREKVRKLDFENKLNFQIVFSDGFESGNYSLIFFFNSFEKKPSFHLFYCIFDNVF